MDRIYIETAYEVLGVAESATDAEIRAAFARLANEYHPDKLAAVADHIPESVRRDAEEKFRKIERAYSALKPKRRNEYDAMLRAARAQPKPIPLTREAERHPAASRPSATPRPTPPPPPPHTHPPSRQRQPIDKGVKVFLGVVGALLLYVLLRIPSSPGSQTTTFGTPVAKEYEQKARPPPSAPPAYPCWDGHQEYACSQQEYQDNLQQHMKQDGWSQRSVQVFVSACKDQASQLAGRGLSEAQIAYYLDSYCKCIFTIFPRRFRTPDDLEKASAEVDSEGRPRTRNARIVQGVYAECAKKMGLSGAGKP